MDSPPLDPVIHQPARLRILAALHRNRQASFTSLRNGLGLTDGNLATHAARLESAGYVSGGRVLTPRGFELRYRITPAGDAAFARYAAALHAILADAAVPPGALTRDAGDEGGAARDATRAAHRA